jgi:hypothetical protein
MTGKSTIVADAWRNIAWFEMLNLATEWMVGDRK